MDEKDNEKHLRVYLGCLKLVGNKPYSEFTHFAEEFDNNAIISKNECGHITSTRDYMLSSFRYPYGKFKEYHAQMFGRLTMNTSGTLLFKNGGRERWRKIKSIMEDLGHIYEEWEK